MTLSRFGMAIGPSRGTAGRSSTRDRLAEVAARRPTPLYVYDVNEIERRLATLKRLFENRFDISYAVKANPNIALLERLLPHIASFDVSSFKEAERGLDAGCPAERLTFSGPAKRIEELRAAIAHGIGELVVESVAEAETVEFVAAELGRMQRILIRINPATHSARSGVSFSGRASQFGIDEEVIDEAIDRILALRHVALVGFHIFSSTNSLDAEAIATNFSIFIRLFRRATERAQIAPEKLVFGSGFGVPYSAPDVELDVAKVARAVGPMLDELKADAPFERTSCVLEMGRWIVGPAGWLLTRVVSEKHSRGTYFRACDAGFNNHLAACGMLGAVIRRNWQFLNLSNPDAAPRRYTLVGPLCTSIDVLASNIDLPEVRLGDVIAVENSGAYGLTASPTRFISHPEPSEWLVVGDDVLDATESRANRWRTWPRKAPTKTFSRR
jgi:diaminopimelate decarboxylase